MKMDFRQKLDAGHRLFGVVLLPVAFMGAGVLFVACSEQRAGSGVAATETRELGPFSRISLNGEADVNVQVGAEQSVSLRADDNLIGDVQTRVQGGTLDISQPDNVDLDPDIGINVKIAIPSLESIELSGAGDVRVTGVSGSTFRTVVSGAGNVTATGKVDRVEVEVTGAGDVVLSELVAGDANVEISGAGDVHVYASDSLSASVSGAGDIVYSGDPQQVEKDVSGVGEIRAE
jgi:hypothetical protein